MSSAAAWATAVALAPERFRAGAALPLAGTSVLPAVAVAELVAAAVEAVRGVGEPFTTSFAVHIAAVSPWVGVVSRPCIPHAPNTISADRSGAARRRTSAIVPTAAVAARTGRDPSIDPVPTIARGAQISTWEARHKPLATITSIGATRCRRRATIRGNVPRETPNLISLRVDRVHPRDR